MQSGRVRTPHLSSIDVVVVSAWMGQVLLEVLGLTPEQIRCAWISDFSVKAGARPTEDLTDVPATVEFLGATPTRDSWHRSDLRIRIGSFIGKVSLVHEAPAQREIFSRVILDRQAPGIYAHLYQRTKHHASHVELSPDGREVNCITSLEPVAAAPAGLSGRYWPMPTLADCVVLVGQLAEVLIYSQHGLNRNAATGLWLREITMRAPCPTDHAFTAPAFARLDRIQQHRRQDWNISRFETTMEACSILVEASLVVTTRV